VGSVVAVGSTVAVGWSVGFSVGGGSVGDGGGRVGMAVGACVGSAVGEAVTVGSRSACVVGSSVSPPMLHPTTSIKTRTNVINLFSLVISPPSPQQSEQSLPKKKRDRNAVSPSASRCLARSSLRAKATFLLTSNNAQPEQGVQQEDTQPKTTDPLDLIELEDLLKPLDLLLSRPLFWLKTVIRLANCRAEPITQ